MVPQPESTPALFRELLDDSKLAFDLREGAIWNAAHTRLCLAPADLLVGITRGIQARAGTQWRTVLKKCGTAWGRRVAERLDHDCQDTLKKRLGEIPMDQYLRFMIGYFTFHGWGTLEIDLTLAPRRGIVQARVQGSIFAAAVQAESPTPLHTDSDPAAMADPMVEGLLAAMLSYVSGRELACIQTSCTTQGAEYSHFIISSRERIARAEARLLPGVSHDEIIAAL